MSESKFSIFYHNIKDQSVEISYKPALYQCMDLAYLWVFCHDIPKAAIQREHAYQVFTMANDLTRQYFDVIPNTPTFVPKTGDLGIFNKGGHIGVSGHICICTGEGDTNRFKSLDQNWGGKQARVTTHDYRLFLGVLRPKKPSFSC